MPIYDYQCDDCGGAFEALVRNESEAKEVACPKCDGPVHRTISLPAQPAAVADAPMGGGCGVGPPCGASWCGRN